MITFSDFLPGLLAALGLLFMLPGILFSIKRSLNPSTKPIIVFAGVWIMFVWILFYHMTKEPYLLLYKDANEPLKGVLEVFPWIAFVLVTVSSLLALRELEKGMNVMENTLHEEERE